MERWEIDGFDLTAIIVKIPNSYRYEKIANFDIKGIGFDEARARAKRAQVSVNCHDILVQACKDALNNLPKKSDCAIFIESVLHTVESMK